MRPGIPPPVDVFPERIGQIWGISSESAKFKPSRASQSPKHHWRLHRSVLASDRGGPPPATSYCFSKFNRGKYGTPCKNWKVNRIHVNVLFIRHNLIPFPTRFALIAAEGQRNCGPRFELSRASPVQGTGGPTPCELNPTVKKKTKQLKQKN